MSRRAVIAALCVLFAGPAAAQDGAPFEANPDGDYLPDPRRDLPLDEAELRAAFTDKTHIGSYNFRRRDIDTFAFEETTTSDGRTVHTHGDKTDRGTWRVLSNVICFEYVDWDGPGGIHRACFNIFQKGNCYYHYAIRGGGFTARSFHEGEQPVCEPGYV